MGLRLLHGPLNYSLVVSAQVLNLQLKILELFARFRVADTAFRWCPPGLSHCQDSGHVLASACMTGDVSQSSPRFPPTPATADFCRAKTPWIQGQASFPNSLPGTHSPPMLRAKPPGCHHRRPRSRPSYLRLCRTSHRNWQLRRHWSRRISCPVAYKLLGGDCS